VSEEMQDSEPRASAAERPAEKNRPRLSRTLPAAQEDGAAELRRAGEESLKVGDVNRAITRYKRLVDRVANGESEDSVARAHTDLGNAYAYAEETVSAVRQFHRAIRLSPKKAEPHFSLAEVYRRNGKTQEAVREYRTAIEYSPRNAFYHFRLGETLTQAGFEAAAVAEFEVAAGLAPTDSFYHFSLSDAYLAIRRIDDAIQEMQTATVFAPRDAYYNLRLGVLYLMSGLARDAADAVEQAVRLEPRNAMYHCILADIYFELDHVAEADAHYRHIGRLDDYDRENVRRIRAVTDLRGGWDLAE